MQNSRMLPATFATKPIHSGDEILAEALKGYTGKPPGRVHAGRIITIRPNLLWNSDGFEIACGNGETVAPNDR